MQYGYTGLRRAVLAAGAALLFASTTLAQPVFTGDAVADFGALSGAVTIADPGGTVDVGVPAGVTDTGWDLKNVYFYYDATTDIAYFGIDCDLTICGDADADGDPGGTSAGLGGNGGVDRADYSFTEAIALALDTNGDFNATFGTGLDVVIGVSSDASGLAASSTFTGFGAYTYTGTAFTTSFAAFWGGAIPNAVTPFANPSAGAPDLEFTIANFSTLPGFGFTPGAGFSFSLNLAHGSQEDDGIGEDFLPGFGNVVDITIPPTLADLRLTKTVDNATPFVGENVIFTVSVFNDGPGEASGVTVEDVLPAGLTFVSASTPDYDSATGVWDVGTLPDGGSAVLTLTATADGPANVQVCNVAEVESSDQDDPDSTPGNGDDTEDDQAEACLTPALEPADLRLTKVADPTAPMVGENVTFTVMVFNDGPGDASGVTVEDVLPAGLTFVSASTPDYDSATGIWNVGTLVNGASEALTLTATAVGPGGVEVCNVAQVDTANEPDPDSTPGNDDDTEDDQAEACVTPVAPPQMADVSLFKDVSNLTPVQGDTLTIKLNLVNSGPDEATQVAVTDTLPAAFTFLDFDLIDGSASFDAATNSLLWEAGTVAVGDTLMLSFTLSVDSVGTFCNIAQVFAADQDDPDSTPGNNDAAEDDQTECCITSSESSGGGDGGVESEGDMSLLLAQRLFQRRQDAQLQRVLNPAPTPLLFQPGMTATHVAAKTAAFDLSWIVPGEGPQQSSAYVVTPTDLLGLTNATSVFAVDYLRPEGRRLGAFFGATSPQTQLYDHAKATCDRLGGGRMEEVDVVEIDGRYFALMKLVHPNGAVDYTISFVAYHTPSGYTVDSRFTPEEYEGPSATIEVLNLQMWSVLPAFTTELVREMLARLEALGPVEYLNTAANRPETPSVYVVDGAYKQGVLTLRLANGGNASTILLEGSTTRTEVNAFSGQRDGFTRTLTLPGAVNGVVTLTTEVGGIYDAVFTLIDPITGTKDRLYFSDGPWSHAQGNAWVTDFAVYPDTRTSEAPSEKVIERSAYLGVSVVDWASLFRYMRPSGQGIDLSDYDAIEFTANGTGRVWMVLEKASIDNADQFGYTFTLQPQPQRFRIPFSALSQVNGAGGFSAEDVTLLAFYVTSNGQVATRYDVVVQDVSFTSSTSVDTEDEEELPAAYVLEQNYPNPFNPVTTIAFTLPEAAHVRLAVYDVLGRQVTVLLDGLRGTGRHTVSFDASTLPSGTYFYRLEAPSQTLTRTLVLTK
jgi:uncharacterized repeat protein (TIGR01451 family)